MDDALQLLDRNKEDAIDLLRTIIQSPETRFNQVRQAISVVVAAGKRKKVRNNIDHLNKYVSLANLILENEHHRQHIQSVIWQELFHFYNDASELVRHQSQDGSQYNGLQFSKSMSEILRGFNILLKADEYIESRLLSTIIEVCRQTLARVGHSETSCHYYIMGCARRLTYYDIEGSRDIADVVLNLGRLRNPDLIYEALLYSCMVGQPYSTLINLGLSVIPSKHVEFIEASELGMPNFRPSADADLTNFVGAIALAKSISHDNSFKRRKIEISGQVLMKMAFSGDLRGKEQVIEWLERYPNDRLCLFWAFVVLGMAIPANIKSMKDINREWDLALRYLNHPECSSAACFLLSKSIPPLHNCDPEQLVNLLDALNSSNPHLTSGSLLLYQSLFQIGILDKKFQQLKEKTLSSWVENQSKNFENFPLLSQFFNVDAPIFYFQREVFSDLRVIAEYSRMKSIKSLNPQEVVQATKDKKNNVRLVNNFVPFDFDLKSPRSLHESLLWLALAARQNQGIPDLYHSRTAAFSDEDLKAFCWFAGLAHYIGWSQTYTEAALTLADWNVPSKVFASISAAVLLLQKPSPVIAFAMCGIITPSFLIQSSELLQLEKLMKSYTFQRSPWIFHNICRLLTFPGIKGSNEANQLHGFMLKLSKSQSVFSRLKLDLIQYGESKDKRDLIPQVSENMRLMALPSFKDKEYSSEDIDMFENKVSVALYLASMHRFSVARLLSMDQQRFLGHDKIHFEMCFSSIGYRSRDQLLSAFVVPMSLNERQILMQDSELPIKRASLFLRPFYGLNLALTNSEVSGIVENVLKESFYGSDSEKSKAIELSYSFILAHWDRTKDPKELWCCFIKNASSSLEPQNTSALSTLENRANLILDNYEVDSSMSAALFAIGLKDVSISFLRKDNLFSCDDAEFMPKLRQLKRIIPILCGKSAEFWYMCITLMADRIEDIDSAFEECKEINAKETEALILWSDYLEIKNVKWLALLGRLGVDRDVDLDSFHRRCELPLACVTNFGKTNLYQAARKQSTIVDEKPSTMETFFSKLMQVHNLLPYGKKRVLNTFIQRSTDCIFPSDVFGKDNWQLEIEYRPLGTLRSHRDTFDAAQNLADLSLRILKQPEFGTGTVEQVPELMPEVIPILVATACSQKIAKEELHDELKSLISNCIEGSNVNTNLALDIHQQCYQLGINSVIPLEKVALACLKLVRDKSGPTLYYSELGSMAVELMWNKNPGEILDNRLVEALRVFFKEISIVHDRAFKWALPKKKHIPSLREITGETSSWQSLQADMIYNEVYSAVNTKPLVKDLKNSSLWNLAERFEGSLNVNNLEQAWWLHQWESYNPEPSCSCSYQNSEFGPLIGLFSDKINSETALARLTRMRTPAVKSIANILYPDPLKTSKWIDDAVSLEGRQIMALKKGDFQELVSVLQTASAHFRSENNVAKSLEFASKLENLNISESSVGFFEETRSISQIENAHVQWMLGQQSSAIETLKGLLEEFNYNTGSQSSSRDTPIQDTDAITKSSPFDVAEIYCQIGAWSREARNEPDHAIMASYFLAAMCYKNDVNAEKIHHTFAHFCSQAYQDPFLESSIADAKHIIRKLAPQLEQIRRLEKSETIKDKKRSLAIMYNSVRQKLEASNNDLHDLHAQRKNLLIRCAQNYILSMAAGDTYEDDMASLISLWLGNSDNVELNEAVSEELGSLGEELRIPVWKFLPWISQLSSRLGSSSLSLPQAKVLFQRALQSIIERAAHIHPYHTLWHLLKISNDFQQGNEGAQDRAEAAKQIIERTSVNDYQVIGGMSTFFRNLIQLGSIRVSASTEYSLVKLLGRRKSEYWRTFLPEAKLPVPSASIPVNAAGDYSSVPVIIKFRETIKIAGGKSRPKVLEFMDSAGSRQRCLLKESGDDLRQDAVMEQVFSIASQTLNRKHRNLYIRTYNVIPLDARIGIIGFVQDTVALMDILRRMHNEYGEPRSEFSVQKAREMMESSYSHKERRGVRVSVFKEVMKHTQPQMRHYWAERFKDASSWLTAKTRWCRSTAVMSIVGYIIGLGDRHCSNLLVDTNSGDVVHIDLGIAFNQGRLLSIPETVPFRLTRDVVDGMGISGTNGVFTDCAELTLKALRNHESRIMTVLEVLKHDTLYTWKLPDSTLLKVQLNESDSSARIDTKSRVEEGQADHALFGVRSRLQESLSSEATVRDLITQARDPTNLALIYWGWAPFY